MYPFLKDGDLVTVTPYDPTLLNRGDLAFAQHPCGSFVLHRVVHGDGTRVSLAGDAFVGNDEELATKYVLGKVIKLERDHREVPLRESVAMFWYRLRPIRQLWRRLTRNRSPLNARNARSK